MSKIYVIGDVFLDKYDFVTNRDNPESSAPCYIVTKTEYKPGGAGNVAMNLLSLGSEVELISVIGDDSSAEILKQLFFDAGLTTSFIQDKSRATILKERVIANTDGRYHYRKDVEKKQYINQTHVEDILAKIDDVDYLIISDYNKGVISKELLECLKKRKPRIVVDPKPNHKDLYKNVFLITPNIKEAKEIANLDNDIESATWIQENLYTQVLLTRSEKGMSFFGKERFDLTADAKKVFDVTGAGDTVIATVTHFLNKNYSMFECVSLANRAAGIAVSHPGCYSVKESELILEVSKT